ncbi:MAG: hypothetical protein IPH98_15095 [Saprospiraceae bacterium]|nr:hypothetical protein [Candidatus Defluviibacterium haderslevense]
MDDGATLLKSSSIDKADFWDCSNGGTTTLQLPLDIRKSLTKLILASPLAKRSEDFPGLVLGFYVASQIGKYAVNN